MLLTSHAVLALPTITLLATGWTMAGGGDSGTRSQYTAGKVSIDALIMRYLK